MTIRVNYYTTDEILIYVKDGNALLKLMDGMGIDACTSRAFCG